MKKFLVVIAVLLFGAGPSLAQKTKAQIGIEINTLLPDNASGQITPLGLRTVTSDIAISIMPTAPVVSGNLACFDGTTGLLKDCASSPTPNAITALTGDITATGPGSVAATLATVNANTGSWGTATQTPQFTVDGKGRITAAANVTVTPALASITGFGTGVATALATNTGSAGSAVINGGALGSPSSVGTMPTMTMGGNITMGSNSITGAFSVSGQTLISTVATGTAPLTVTSTTNVPNLNASSISGATFASPGSIGSGTPGSGAFTTLSATTPLPLASGGTARTTATSARDSGGLNIDQFTGHGDSIYTILATDRTVGTNAAFTASRTWTLPAANAVNAGQEIIIADFQGTVTAGNTLVIARAGSDTINGGTSATISAANGAYLLKSDGVSKWTAQSMGAASGGGVTSVTCFGTSITTSGTCTTAATKSDQQTATSTTAVVTPSQQQQHPSALKVAGVCINTGAAYTVQTGSYNVSSCTKNSTGNVTINFTTAFAANTFVCNATIYQAGAVLVPYLVTPTVAGSVSIIIESLSSVATDQTFAIMCSGIQ